MVWMMAQTHYLMAAPLPSLVFKKAEFIAVMFKLELRIASVASREVIEEDVRYSNIAKLSWTIRQFFFPDKKLLLVLIKFTKNSINYPHVHTFIICYMMHPSNRQNRYLWSMHLNYRAAHMKKTFCKQCKCLLFSIGHWKTYSFTLQMYVMDENITV